MSEVMRLAVLSEQCCLEWTTQLMRWRAPAMLAEARREVQQPQLSRAFSLSLFISALFMVSRFCTSRNQTTRIQLYVY